MDTLNLNSLSKSPSTNSTVRARSWSLLESTKKIPKLKIAIVGDCGVGKSTFVQTLIQNSDESKSEMYHTTSSLLGYQTNNNKNPNKFILTNSFEDSQNHEYQILIKSEKNSLLWVHIWDTAGEEKFRSITSTFYRACDLIIVMYDVSDMETLDNVKYWLEDIERYAPPNVPVFIFANKIDLLKNDSLVNISIQLAETKYHDYVVKKSQSTDWESAFKLVVEIADCAYEFLEKKIAARQKSVSSNNQKHKSPVPSPKIILDRLKSYSPKNQNKKSCI